jgi:hypothetical protein
VVLFTRNVYKTKGCVFEGDKESYFIFLIHTNGMDPLKLKLFHLCPCLPSSVFPLCVRIQFAVYLSTVFTNSHVGGEKICEHKRVTLHTSAGIRTGCLQNKDSAPYLHGICVTWRQFNLRSRSLLQQPTNTLRAV